MDLGFLSGLLGNKEKGNSPLTMLLPLLLGKNGDDRGNNPLQGLFANMMNGNKASEDAFPPLFGAGEEKKNDFNGLLNMIGKLSPSAPNISSEENIVPDYPYELQYNRPEK